MKFKRMLWLQAFSVSLMGSLELFYKRLWKSSSQTFLFLEKETETQSS